MALGAEGVQMGTRFVTTEECDADPAFKQSYLDATQQDIEIIKAPWVCRGGPSTARSSTG